MLTSLAKHSFGAILLVVIIEEVGIPLPIPSDFLVIFAGTTADHSLSRLVMFYVALTMASGIGASGLSVYHSTPRRTPAGRALRSLCIPWARTTRSRRSVAFA